MDTIYTAKMGVLLTNIKIFSVVDVSLYLRRLKSTLRFCHCPYFVQLENVFAFLFFVYISCNCICIYVVFVFVFVKT